MLILELCCGFVFLVAGAIVWGWRIWNRRGFQTAVPLDGALCLWTEDGRSLVIKNHYVRNIVYLMILLLPLLFILYHLIIIIISFIIRFSQTPFSGWLILVGIGSLAGIIAAYLAAGVVSLVRSMRRPSVHIEASSNLLQIGRGAARQQIPFTDILFIGLGYAGRDPFGNPKVGVFEIEVMLANEQLLQLCSISGDYESAKRRSIKVAKQLAEICQKPMMIKKPWAIQRVSR